MRVHEPHDERMAKKEPPSTDSQIHMHTDTPRCMLRRPHVRIGKHRCKTLESSAPGQVHFVRWSTKRKAVFHDGPIFIDIHMDGTMQCVLHIARVYVLNVYMYIRYGLYLLATCTTLYLQILHLHITFRPNSYLLIKFIQKDQQKFTVIVCTYV